MTELNDKIQALQHLLTEFIYSPAQEILLDNFNRKAELTCDYLHCSHKNKPIFIEYFLRRAYESCKKREPVINKGWMESFDTDEEGNMVFRKKAQLLAVAPKSNEKLLEEITIEFKDRYEKRKKEGFIP